MTMVWLKAPGVIGDTLLDSKTFDGQHFDSKKAIFDHFKGRGEIIDEPGIDRDIESNRKSREAKEESAWDERMHKFSQEVAGANPDRLADEFQLKNYADYKQYELNRKEPTKP